MMYSSGTSGMGAGLGSHGPCPGWLPVTHTRCWIPAPLVLLDRRSVSVDPTVLSHLSLPTHCHSERSEESLRVPTRMVPSVDHLANTYPTTKRRLAASLSSCALPSRAQGAETLRHGRGWCVGSWVVGQRAVPPLRSRRRETSDRREGYSSPAWRTVFRRSSVEGMPLAR
jgi:hypothetical protein